MHFFSICCSPSNVNQGVCSLCRIEMKASPTSKTHYQSQRVWEAFHTCRSVQLCARPPCERCWSPFFGGGPRGSPVVSSPRMFYFPYHSGFAASAAESETEVRRDSPNPEMRRGSPEFFTLVWVDQVSHLLKTRELMKVSKGQSQP